MKISACPRCGSTRIFQGTMSDGTITGITTRQVCRDCGYQGPPVLFDSEEEYQKFKQELQANLHHEEPIPEDEKQPQDEPALTKEDKEIAALLEETDSTQEPPRKSSYLAEFVLAIIFSLSFFIVLIGGSYFGITNFLSRTDLISILLYLLGSFIGVLIFFFLLIVLLETLYRGIRYRKKTTK